MHYLLKKIIIGVLVVLGVCYLVLYGILSNPKWFSSSIEAVLARQGLVTEITSVSPTLDRRYYQILATFSTHSDAYGVSIKNATASAQVAWADVIFGRSFVKKLIVEYADVSIDRQQLLKSIREQSSEAKTTKKLRYLPEFWEIKSLHIASEGQRYHLSGQGSNDGSNDEIATRTSDKGSKNTNRYAQTATIQLNDSQHGVVTAEYHSDRAELRIRGQQLDLYGLTGYAAQLNDLSASINFDDWFASRVETELLYKGIQRQLHITGDRNNALHVVATADDSDKQLSITAHAIDNHQAAQIVFDEMDVSALELIAPLLPRTLVSEKNVEKSVTKSPQLSFPHVSFPRLSGIASGVVNVEKSGLVRDAQITLNDVSVEHNQFSTQHLSGDIHYRDKVLSYNCSLANSPLFLPSVFRNKLPGLFGEIGGSYDIEKRRLAIEHADLHNRDIAKIAVSGHVDVKQREIVLVGNVRNADISKRRLYIPKQLPPKTTAYLGNALVSGNRNDTTFSIKGKFKQLFTSPKPKFSIHSRLYNGQFQYLRNNPIIAIADADFSIEGRQLHVDVKKGDIAGFPLTGEATISDILHATVDVDAHVSKQSIKKILPVAEKSIARNVIQRVKRVLRANGTVSVDLSLSLPIYDKKAKDRFDVTLAAENARVVLQAYPELPILHQQALIKINETGLLSVTATNQERTWEKITIGRDKKQRYVIDVTDSKPLVTTLQQLKIVTKKQAEVLKKYHVIAGNTLSRTHVILDVSGQLEKVDASSDLTGLSLNAFSLLVKGSQTTLPMTFSYDHTKKHVVLNLKKRLRLEIGLSSKGGVQGIVLSNGASTQSYHSGVAHIDWHSRQFKMAQFQKFYKEFVTNDSAQQFTLSPKLDIAIDKVVLNNGYQTNLVAKGDAANLSVSGGLLEGSIQYRKNQLNAQLRRLNVSELFEVCKKTAQDATGREVVAFDLANNLPQMKIAIDTVIFKGSNVGNASINTSIRDNRYSIDEILLNGSDYYLLASGYEAEEPQGITTHVQFDFKGENIQHIIQAFRLNPILNGKFIDISAALSWPGKADTLNFKQSYGKASIRAENIKLVNMSGGFGSVVGLMDVVGILKRVTMDFKNLTSSKISFDVVTGDWNIGGGRAITRNAVATGSVIDVKINGAIDLHRRTFDDVAMVVVPKASNIIPLVGAVAGGVVGGAIGFVVQQVVGDSVNEAVGIPYVISGDWEKPVLTAKGDVVEKKQPTNVVQPAPITLESTSDDLPVTVPKNIILESIVN